MARFVRNDLFTLELGQLVEAHAQGKVVDVFAAHGALLAKRPRHSPPEEADPPIALRWVLREMIGIPRAPFRVWRHRRPPRLDPALSAQVNVRGTAEVTFPAGPMLEVRFDAAPDPGSTVRVRALDEAGAAIPGQRLDFAAPATGLLRHPGIAGLRVEGGGALIDVRGLLEGDYVNDPGWVEIEIVGLPYDQSETTLPEYDPQPQGFPAATAPGLDAALVRLDIARLLQLEPPPSPATGMTVPPWPPPDPVAYLKVVRGGTFDVVRDCLQNTDDSDPTRRQDDYLVTLVGGGLRQIGQPAPVGADPTEFTVTAPGLVGLAVTTDSAAATALGYGTIDIPVRTSPPRLGATVPAGTTILPYDYMVTAEVTLPYFGTIELAALGALRPGPASVSGLQVRAASPERPRKVDDPGSQHVALVFNPPRPRMAGALLTADRPGVARVLNPARLGGAGGYEPYALPAPAAGQVQLAVPDAPLPVAGSRSITYVVGGQDPFGRWAPWATAVHAATAGPVQRPGLHSVSIEPQRPLPATGKVTPATITLEFSWDWADRSPEKIELRGAFVPLGPTPPPRPPAPLPGASFQLANGAAPGAPVVVGFGGGRVPTITSGHVGTVSELASTLPPGRGEVARYRLQLTGAQLDFSAAGELGYAVAAVGYERVRPIEPSAPVGPLEASTADPFAPTPPVLPIDVIWTALPDAAGRARAVLSWPASPGADGYFVWEATEAALLRAVGAPPPAAGSTALQRVQSLRAAVTASAAAQDRSLQAFSRMSDRRLRATSVELELPGDADSLYAYRVSSVSAQHVESSRSTSLAVVAVPRLNRPRPPRLQVRPVRQPAAGVELTVVPGLGAPPAGIEVHRVRNPLLAGEIGTMGPPVVAAGSAGWSSVTVEVPGRPGEAGLRRVDPVAPSWTPLHYRVVAIGAHQPAAGDYGGESPPSDVQVVVLPPAGPPAVSGVWTTLAADGFEGGFETTLPSRPTPLGRGRIVLATLAARSSGPPVATRAIAAFSDELPALAGFPATITRAHLERDPTAPAGTLKCFFAVPLPLPGGATFAGVRVELTDPRGDTTMREIAP